nr:MAG TPA: virulence factor membrane-bound polymerase [Caudoviricetes sp.]
MYWLYSYSLIGVILYAVFEYPLCRECDEK